MKQHPLVQRASQIAKDFDPRKLTGSHMIAVESAIALQREKEALLNELQNLRADSINKAYSAMIADFEAIAKRYELPMPPDTSAPAARIISLFKGMVERVDSANKAMQRLHELAGVPAGQDAITAIEEKLYNHRPAQDL